MLENQGGVVKMGSLDRGVGAGAAVRRTIERSTGSRGAGAGAGAGATGQQHRTGNDSGELGTGEHAGTWTPTKGTWKNQSDDGW